MHGASPNGGVALPRLEHIANPVAAGTVGQGESIAFPIRNALTGVVYCRPEHLPR